jgi:hypothetical protein
MSACKEANKCVIRNRQWSIIRKRGDCSHCRVSKRAHVIQIGKASQIDDLSSFIIPSGSVGPTECATTRPDLGRDDTFTGNSGSRHKIWISSFIAVFVSNCGNIRCLSADDFLFRPIMFGHIVSQIRRIKWLSDFAASARSHNRTRPRAVCQRQFFSGKTELEV